jgi:hypothetical protein
VSYPQAIAHRGQAHGGGSLPQLFDVAGLGYCIVKYKENPQGLKSLVNELIGFQLADILVIEHPLCGIVEIDNFSIGGLKLPIFDDGYDFSIKPGLHFYSQWLESAKVATVNLFKNSKRLQNPGMMAGIVVLDLLLSNWDRKPTNPNLIVHMTGKKSQLALIDLGFAFGSSIWEIGNITDTALPPQHGPLPYSGNMAGFFAHLRPKDFTQYVGRLSGINSSAISQIIGQVPSEWGLTAAEQNALIHFLQTRAAALPAYLEQRLQRGQWWL